LESHRRAQEGKSHEHFSRRKIPVGKRIPGISRARRKKGPSFLQAVLGDRIVFYAAEEESFPLR